MKKVLLQGSSSPRGPAQVQATNIGGNQTALRLGFRRHEVGLMGEEACVDLDLETAVGECSSQCEIDLEGDVLMTVSDATGAIIARCWLNVHMEAAAASFAIHTDKFQSASP